MIDLKELFEARKDMEEQDNLYRPTSFWADASTKMVSDFEQNGVENFRSLSTPLSFFVPTFGVPGGGFSQEQVDNILNHHKKYEPENSKQQTTLNQFFEGRMSALADYRVLIAGDDEKKFPQLDKFSESEVGNPIEHFTFGGRKFSRSSLNYLLGLCFLKQHIGDDVPKTILEIGGGFGTLGEILNVSGIKNSRYIDVDIPPTSFAAQYYLSEILGEKNIATYNKTKHMDKIDIKSLPQASVLCSWQIEQLQGTVDLFVNFISFQEMEPSVVANYFEHVRRLETKWILLRNMREGKNKKKSHADVGVEAPILAENYAQMLPDYSLIAKNVFPYGFQTVDGYHSELYLFKRQS